MAPFFIIGDTMDSVSKALLIKLPSGKEAFKRGAIVFTNGGGISDFIIRAAQGFRGYTHCGIALGDGKMVAAWGAAGCVVLQDDLQQMTTEARYPNTTEQEITRALASLGKPYDFLGLFGLLGLPTWGKGPPDAYFCSSLIADILYIGTNSIRPARKTLPNNLWMYLNK